MTFWKKLFRSKLDTKPSEGEHYALLLRLERNLRDLHEVRARKRERATKAITKKNHFRQVVDDLEKKVRTLTAKVEFAEGCGDSALAESLRYELSIYEANLVEPSEALKKAVETVEQIKATITLEEERIQQKTAEILLLRTQWDTMQVQEFLTTALVEINTGVPKTIPNAQQEAWFALNQRFLQQAIAQRDNLRQIQADTEKRVLLLREIAKETPSPTVDLAELHLREIEQYEAIHEHMGIVVRKAEDITEQTMNLLKVEEVLLKARGIVPFTISEEQIVVQETKTVRADVEHE